ncbi:MAG: SEC-C metal-binding domain-containing protein [Thiomonas sp.]
MTVQVQTQEQAEAAAEQIEQRAQSLHNLVFQHPEAAGAVAADGGLEAGELAVAAAAAGAVSMQPIVNAMPKVGRNDLCPCGSGKKYKHCHGKLS